VIHIVATGGTIANTGTGRLHIDEVVAAVPGLEAVAAIEMEEATLVQSSALTFTHFAAVARRIHRAAERPVPPDGIVVTTGSNQTEDLAYFLHLVLDVEVPVVVTAAQRKRDELSEDATRNLLDAARVAADPATAGKGVVVVVNELIHSAREVTKEVVSRVDAWSSAEFGALGIVSQDRVAYYRAPTRRHTVTSELRYDLEAELPAVEIVYAHAGATGALVHAAVAAGARGLVVAGFLTGVAFVEQRAALRDAVDRGVPVVMATRGREGRLPSGLGGYLTADTLTPQKAAILLRLALLRTDDPAQLQRLFDRH
jgi:L-asparaginase